jgi:hypothetical protein
VSELDEGAAKAPARARGCRCRPQVRWIAPNAITLIHRDGCPLIATLPTLPEGGHLAATWIAWPEESRP